MPKSCIFLINEMLYFTIYPWWCINVRSCFFKYKSIICLIVHLQYAIISNSGLSGLTNLVKNNYLTMPAGERVRIGNLEGRLIAVCHHRHGTLWDVLINGITRSAILGHSKANGTIDYRPPPACASNCRMNFSLFLNTFIICHNF